MGRALVAKGHDVDRILVATNDSPTSARAVAFAIELASPHNTELVFVHVGPTLDTSSFDEDTIVAIAHEPPTKIARSSGMQLQRHAPVT